MILIGDIHADMLTYLGITKVIGSQPSIQLGDFGIGFCVPPIMESKHRFIRGNHDDPAGCKAHPNYLGDYGCLMYRKQNVFYVSGARSIDAANRLIGVSWWEDEELSWPALRSMIKLYEQLKPDVVLSHDLPLTATGELKGNSHRLHSRTAEALDACYRIHQPQKWYAGHHHVRWTKVIGSTRFRVLGINEFCTM